MPGKGWYSLTVRLSTARMIREMALAKGLTVDELLNELISVQSKLTLISMFQHRWPTSFMTGDTSTVYFIYVTAIVNRQPFEDRDRIECKLPDYEPCDGAVDLGDFTMFGSHWRHSA